MEPTAPESPAVEPTAAEVGKAIEVSFPDAIADSGEAGKADLMSQVPDTHVQTRQLLDEPPTELPSSMGGWFGEDPWVLPETGETVTLDVTKEGSLGGRTPLGPPDMWLYEDGAFGGEPGVRTAFQQLPGKNVRIFKIIGEHKAPPDAPTELAFYFERRCVGFLDRTCSVEDCGFFGGGNCVKRWTLTPYSYLGTEGVLLADPNPLPKPLEVGTPKAFLTEPVAFDANQNPVRIEWEISGDDTVNIRVYDNDPGVVHPVTVDPIVVLAARWLAPATLRAVASSRFMTGLRAQVTTLVVTGCAIRAWEAWPQTEGQDWYRRVWRATLKCFEGL